MSCLKSGASELGSYHQHKNEKQSDLLMLSAPVPLLLSVSVREERSLEPATGWQCYFQKGFNWYLEPCSGCLFSAIVFPLFLYCEMFVFVKKKKKS